MTTPTILVTGGTGYIGSHTCVELLEAGFEVIALDNFSNSNQESLNRIKTITGKTVQFVQADVRDRAALDAVFKHHSVHSVIHFAGLKAVGESVAQPLKYYDNNVQGSITLLNAMQAAGVNGFVFSSSATVYGNPDSSPIPETAPLRTESPYAASKLMVEGIVRDYAQANPALSAVTLRYFNPVGAHESGLIGEDPNGIPNNLMPFVTQVAVGRREKLSVFGGDYPTADGTGVRDYIHVVDLAKGHVAAVNHLMSHTGLSTFNLGTGVGYSVLDVIAAFEKASGQKIPYDIVARRPGDVPAYWSDPGLAADVLKWRVSKTLEDMCADSWRWQHQNPNGYRA